MVEPVRISVDPRARSIGVRNLHHTRDSGYLRWEWRLEEDGTELGHGELAVPVIPAGQAGSVEWTQRLMRLVDQDGAGEVWLTVSAVTDEAESWAPAGHEVAWAQERIGRSRTHKAVGRPGAAAGGSAPAGGSGAAARGSAAEVDGDVIALGAARFDGRTGELIRLGGLELDGPRVEVWRAPIDNDRPLVTGWRRAGLDRVQHKVLGVEVGGFGADGAGHGWGAAGTDPGAGRGLPVEARRRSGCG